MTGRFFRTRIAALAVVLVAGVAVVTAGEGHAVTKVTVTDSTGDPNNRTSSDPTPNAFDGSTSTFTWTTESGNFTQPSYLIAGFASTKINRIRIFKQSTDSYGPHDLVIQTTTDTGSLTSRTWTNVAGLTNGFGGTELLTATAVNAAGTVQGDSHNSSTEGFASLTFTPVVATGLRIGFDNTALATNNHYNVSELEIYPAPSTGFASITLTRPNGGGTFARGAQLPVRWTYKNADGETVRIVLFKGTEAISTLAHARAIGTDGKGSFSKTIPNWLPPGTNYRVHLYVNGKKAHDGSDATFSIT